MTFNNTSTKCFSIKIHLFLLGGGHFKSNVPPVAIDGSTHFGMLFSATCTKLALQIKEDSSNPKKEARECQ